MRKTLFSFGFSILIQLWSSCQSDVPKDLEQYILAPDAEDYTCLDDIQRAKEDISKGKIVFTTPCSLFDCTLRQEKYLKQLCSTYGMEHQYEMFSDIIEVGQRQGCYGAYMDLQIANKYGKQFKENLLRKADSLLVVHQDTIGAYLCDELPFALDNVSKNEEVFVVIPDLLKQEFKVNNKEHFDFVDVYFYIDRFGFASGYHLKTNDPLYPNCHSSVPVELLEIAILRLMRIQQWKPGKIDGHKMNVKHSIRVYLK